MIIIKMLININFTDWNARARALLYLFNIYISVKNIYIWPISMKNRLITLVENKTIREKERERKEKAQ
jgi:hypothetical protein